jgi:histidinol-phosphatase (PHP family)
MRLASYHTHTTFCDGNDTASSMAQAAFDGGMTDLGFTAHAAFPFASEWHLDPTRYEEYGAEIARLKNEWKGRLNVLHGFEADFIPGVTVPDRAAYARFSPDFLIGSVHYVSTNKRHSTATLWAVDAPTGEVSRGIEACFDGDGRRAVEAYWETLREMVQTCDFDIIGHLDIPRKRNGTLRFFDEDATWYRRELKKTVRAIADSGKIVEINTGGIARKAIDDVYPSTYALDLLSKEGVPITISSDAHSTRDITCAYDRAREAARKAGYATLSFLGENGWQQERF